MTKFLYNSKNNSLAVWDETQEKYFPVKIKKVGIYENYIFYISEISEEDYISVSFNQNKTKVNFFYKKIDLDYSQRKDFWEPEKVDYFRKWIDLKEEIYFDFSENDRVEKIDGKWVRKIS